MINSKESILLLMITFLTCLYVQGQKPVLYFQQTNTSNGLSNNKVNCLLQDKRGFMWIGTDDGLNRYDGKHFTIFRNKPSDIGSLSGNIITDLQESENGIIWIATADGGITRYDYRLPNEKQFKQFKHNPTDKKSIPVNIINCLLIDSAGCIWLGTSGAGVIQFIADKELFIPAPVSANTTCIDLCLDKDGMLWVGRQGGGYCKINPHNNQYTVNPLYNNLYAKLPYMAINSLLPDKDGVWIGSWDKALYQVTYKQEERKILPGKSLGSFNEDEITAFAKDSKGNLYLGGKSKGLQYFDQASNYFYQFGYDASKAGTIGSYRINCLLFDKSGMLWAGTDKGLSRSNPLENQFVQTFLPIIKDKPAVKIYDFFRYADDELWIGTNMGIFIQNTTGNFRLEKINYQNTPLEITSFFKDIQTGEIYVGTNYSLFRLNMKTWQPVLLPNTDKDIVMRKLIDSRIVSIEKDTIQNHPVLVVLPYGHFLAVYDLTDKKWISRADTSRKIVSKFGLKDNLIRKIDKSGKGEWLLATAKEGLGNWEEPFSSTIKFSKNSPGKTNTLSSNNVYDFIPDQKGNLWVSTFGGGLNYYNRIDNKFFHISSSANLSEGIALDKMGDIWSISNGNIFRYAKKDNTTDVFTLPDINKSGGVSGKIFTDYNQDLLVSGQGYFIRFNPEYVKPAKSEGNIYFTDFRIFNTSFSNLLEEKVIELSYRQSYFSFEFAVPSFGSSQPVEYFCKMEGEDKEWVSLGTRNFTGYSNLGGGKYTFRVKAVLPGTKRSELTSIQITIIPPFWKRWWFFAILILFTGLVAYLVYRYRINELLKRHAIRNKIAQDLHDSMGSTLSSISVYSQVAKIYQQQTRETELSSVLDKISETSTGMISDMNDIVWSLQPANDDMNKIIDRMESFALPLCVAKNIHLEMIYHSDIRRMNLPMEIRKNLYLIFKEAINNVIKYSEAGCVAVTLSVSDEVLSMIIADDGKGFMEADKKNVGNGLTNMRRRTEEMNGKFLLNNTSGTQIIVSIPIP